MIATNTSSFEYHIVTEVQVYLHNIYLIRYSFMTDKWTIVILWVFLYHTESNTSGLSQNYNNVIGTRCSEWFFLINIARYFSTWRKFRSLADDIAWSESLVFLIIGLFHAIFLQFNFDYLWKESHQKKIKEYWQDLVIVLVHGGIKS